MDILTLLILGLATYRLTRLFHNEAGPFNLIGRFRSLIGVAYDEKSNRIAKNELAATFNCVHCLGMWMAFMVWAGYYIPEAYLFYWLYTPLAISAISSLLFLRLGSD